MRDLPVFFSKKMLAQTNSISPSAIKPLYVMESWQKLGIPLRIIEPNPIDIFYLYRVHDSCYVNDVLALKVDNGFGNRAADVAASLLYTNGSMLAAAREAIANRQVAVAPCSGFHHAGYIQAEGFCTFNGLMATASALHHELPGSRIGILDFDMHYGNGTDDIIRQLNIYYVTHYSAGAEYYSHLQSDTFLKLIPNIVATMSDCDIILYQAGVDPHVDDPFGGWLTDEQLRARDALVFETCRAMKIPVAWNLAGGYQSPFRKVLDIHDRTLQECWRVYGETVDVPE